MLQLLAQAWRVGLAHHGDTPMAEPDSKTLDTFLQAQGKALREKDRSPATAKEWQDRRTRLVKQMSEAMGPVPDQDCQLDAKDLGVIELDGYVFERVVIQSRHAMV